MSFDRKDFAEAQAKRHDRETRSQLPAFRLISSAAPVMNRLMTESDAWNRFLTILQGQVERITRLRDDVHQQILNPALWNDEAMRKLKADALQADAMLESLQFVMELPKALQDDGAKAQEIVAKFEAKDESAGQSQS